MSANSVNLLTGPYRAGKSLNLLEDLVDYLAASPLSGRPAILTVPSHRYKALVEERLARVVARRTVKLPGLFGLKILPFYDLCHYILRQTGQSFRVLPDALRPALLEKAIAEVRGAGRLSNLSDIADFAGTHAGMLELIDELERAGLSPKDVLATLSKEAATTARYMELGRIYEAYWRELEALNIYDERKLAFKTREVLNNMDKGALPVGFFAVDGFDRFNRLQLQVFAGMAGQADRATICFDFLAPDAVAGGHGDNQEISGALAGLPLGALLADSSAESAFEKEHVNPFDFKQNAHDYAWKEKSMRDMREVFGAQLSEKAISPGAAPAADVDSFRALDRMLEIDELVRRLKHVFELDPTLHNDDVVVVVRSVAPYLTAIRAAFEKAGIGYYLDEPVLLPAAPLVKYLLRLIGLSENDFVRQDVIRTLASPFCRLEYLGLTSSQVEDIDNKSLEATVVSGVADWRPLTQFETIEKLFTAVTPPSGDMTFTRFVAWIEDLIDKLLTLPNDDEYSDPRVIWEQHQALLELRRVLSNMILEENLLGSTYAGRTYTFAKLLERLERNLEQANFRRPRGKADVVTVCGADLVPNRKYKVIFVAGLVEGEFPRRSEKPGFVSRDEVSRWKNFGIDIENARHHESFEGSLYKSLLERATDKLYLSSPLFEISGEELTPSFFLSQGDDKILERVPFVAPFRNSLIDPVSVLDQASGLLWQNLSQEEYFKTEALSDLYANLKESIGVVHARSMPGAVNTFAVYNGGLDGSVSAGILSVKMPSIWSVSRLNDFGKCAFRFWVSHVLKIKPVEEPEAGIDARLLGELYHKALEIFYSRLKDLGLTILSNERERLLQIYEESIAAAVVWLENDQRFKRSEFWEYEQKDIYFRLRRFFLREIARAEKVDGQFTPTAFEAAFGFDDDENSAPPLVIGPPGKQVKLRGKIDRLDRSTSGEYRVIDYKAGSSSIKADEALAGRNMQLPVYALALSAAIEPGARVLSGSYLSISSGEAIGNIDFNSPDMDAIGQVQQNILDFTQSIAAGKFTIGPTAANSCDFCDHSQVCRISELNKTGALEPAKNKDFEDFGSAD